MSKTDSFEIASLNVFRGVTLTGITPWLALFVANPGEAEAGEEMDGNGYARVAVTFDVPDPVTGLMQNSTELIFPTALADWGFLSHWGLWSAATAGTLKRYGALSTPVIVLQDQTVRVPIGYLVLGED